MNYFVIKYSSGAIGCPTILYGDLSSDWEWDIFDPHPEKFIIQNKYIFTIKQKKIDFDYWNDHNIGSANFIKIAIDHGATLRTIPLDIIQSNKKRPDKNYFYVLWSDWYSTIDLERSDYIFYRDLETNEIVYNKYFRDVASLDMIKKYYFDKSKDPKKDLFKSLDFRDETICSERFMDACIKAKLKGMEFIPIEEYQEIPFWHDEST